MKNSLRMGCVLMLIATLNTIPLSKASAQCVAGSSRDTLNWDYLDFIPNSGTYVSPIAFTTLALCQNQKFTVGKNMVTVTHNYTGGNVGGDVTTHTGEVGTYGKGADIRFRGNGSVAFTFRDPVRSLKFSIQDIDLSQSIGLSAFNGVVPVNITATNLAGTILLTTGSGTPSVVATSSATAIANNANTPAANGTLNVEVTGPVTSISIKVTGTATNASEDGSFFVSDLSACMTGSFPLNYYYVSKPFTGQPSYFLAVMNNRIFYVNVATGEARLLFQDNGHTNINSLAYDPYRHMVYYAFSLTSNSQADKTIFRYDYDMDTMGVFIPNVNNIGIPTFQTGVESGAAGFYDGAYYVGIEGNDQAGANSARESMIWRIDLDTTNFLPTTVAQVWATPVDDGNGIALHDWSDVGFNDGIMYDFDGANNQTDFYHKNLLTGECINIKPSPTSLVPRQVSVTWAGQMYNSGSPNAVSSGTLAPYNGNGTVNTALQRTMMYQGVAVSGSWGDAGEAFKPKTDFGDAPASYDPPGVDPGTHERNDSIRLGNLIGIEWRKKTSSDATGDGVEEDGVTGLQIIPAGINNYFLPVRVFNRTNRNATLAGWVDANGNGVYESSEGTTAIVPGGINAMQIINLSWTALPVTLPALSSTFLRLRVATVNEGMTVSKPNGYFDNGEIEDHLVTVSQVLTEQQLSLYGRKDHNGYAQLLWQLNSENGFVRYELQQSCNTNNWVTIHSRNATGQTGVAYFNQIDSTPCTPVSYYRIKAFKSGGSHIFSATKKIDFTWKSSIRLSPNPARNNVILQLTSDRITTAFIQVIDMSGKIVLEERANVLQGVNNLNLPGISILSAGAYKVRVQLESTVLSASLLKQ